jgi:hypothetical protein
MKRIYLLIILVLSSCSIFSQGLGVGVGPSFWTVNDISIKDNNVNLVDKNKKVGLNVNARVKLGSDNLKYVFNAGWNRFSIDQITITDSRYVPATTYNITLSQNIFPLSAGLELGFPASSSRIYVCGDAVYNIIKNSIDYDKTFSGYSLGIPVIFGDQTAYRMGASVGAGVELKLAFLLLDINARLHFMNLFNKDKNETSTSFLMSNISIFFGN